MEFDQGFVPRCTDWSGTSSSTASTAPTTEREDDLDAVGEVGPDQL